MPERPASGKSGFFRLRTSINYVGWWADAMVVLTIGDVWRRQALH
jgi:hypothetical protein